MACSQCGIQILGEEPPAVAHCPECSEALAGPEGPGLLTRRLTCVRCGRRLAAFENGPVCHDCDPWHLRRPRVVCELCRYPTWRVAPVVSPNENGLLMELAVCGICAAVLIRRAIVRRRERGESSELDDRNEDEFNGHLLELALAFVASGAGRAASTGGHEGEGGQPM